MKNILVPVNFSDVSLQAIQYAIDFASHYRGQVTVMHAFEEPPLEAHTPGDMLPELLQEEREATIAKLRQQIDSINPDKDAQLNLVALPGPVTDAIDNFQASAAVDFIIVGAHPASGVEEWLTGTIASSLITHMAVPVLVVPEGAAFHPVHHIAIAVEEEQDVMSRLDKIQELVNPLGARLSLVHVAGDKEEPGLEAQLRRDFSQFPNVAIEVIPHSDVADALSEFAEKNQVDVLALIFKNNSFWDSLFNRSVTKRMTYHTQVPLLSLPFHIPTTE